MSDNNTNNTISGLGQLVMVETPINVKRLAMWSVTEGNVPDNTSIVQDVSQVIDFDKRLMNYSDQPQTASAQLYGCGDLARNISRITGGTLSIGIHALSADERSTIFGETTTTQTAGKLSTLTGHETSKYLIVAIAEELPNGNLNLRKYYHVEFRPGQSGTAQMEGSNITFSTSTLEGTYFRNEALDKIRDILFNVDPSVPASATAIESWFTTADSCG